MPWTWHEMEKLWNGVQEVNYLRYEEQQNCFAEVSQNANHCKCHSRQVTKGVANKNSGWISVKNENKIYISQIYDSKH